jgi:heme/copper-type cytochrome/quinol oxidase subunit 2
MGLKMSELLLILFVLLVLCLPVVALVAVVVWAVRRSRQRDASKAGIHQQH